MIEVLAKEPQAVLQSLQTAGAACGPAAATQASAACAPENFCALPGGETICVFGPQQLSQMSQVTREAIVQAAAQPAAPEVRGISEMEILSVAAVFIAGIALGRYWPKARKNPQGPAGTP